MSNVIKLTPRPHGGVIEHPPIEVIKIVVGIDTLADGHEICNVHIGNVVLHAVNHHEGFLLADRLAYAINTHTLDAAEVVS